MALQRKSRSSRKFTHGSANRLKKSAEFARLQKSGKKLTSRHFLIILNRATGPNTRLGITITRKVDRRATARNRLKRRIREVFRQNRHKLSGNFDIVIIARQNAQQCKLLQIRKEILGTLSHAGFLKDAAS